MRTRQRVVAAEIYFDVGISSVKPWEFSNRSIQRLNGIAGDGMLKVCPAHLLSHTRTHVGPVIRRRQHWAQSLLQSLSVWVCVRV